MEYMFKKIAKWVIRIRKWKDRQHNGQTKKEKQTNHDMQNTTHKTKNQVTRTSLKYGGEHRCPWMVNSSCLNVGQSWNKNSFGTIIIRCESD
jgi:hypothetical protein